MTPSRRTSTLLVLAGIAAFALLCLASPRFLTIAHHYANFVAVGRSTVKIAVIGIFAALIYGGSLIRPLLSAARARHLLVSSLYCLLGLTMLSTLGMAALVTHLDVPLRTSFYAVNDSEFSFGHLTHSHLYRPVSYLAQRFVPTEVGTAWSDVLHAFFGIPGPVLICFYALLGLFLAWTVLAGVAYAQHLRGAWLKTLYLLAAIAVIKSGADGAFLDLAALLGTSILGLIVRDRFLALLPLPFLVLDAFLWFTPQYGAQLGVSLLFFGSIALLHAASRTRSTLRRYASALCAAAMLAGFLGAGSRVSFFGGDAEAAVPSSELTIPAGQPVYFLARGANLPAITTTTATTSPAAFVREHEAIFENERESLRMPGISCRTGDTRLLFNQVRIFTPDGEAREPIAVSPWITATRSGTSYRIELDSCLPDTLRALARGIKTQFPDEAIVIAFVR